jgi:4-hydroxy-3-polyprenylbenzoate decarboxylase
MGKQKIIVGITGASGAIYAKVLLEKLSALKDQVEEVGIVMSDNAVHVWETELDKDKRNGETGKQRRGEIPNSPILPFSDSKLFSFYNKTDFTAPFASGSSDFRTMIVCPCSMGTLGRIANGISNDLITRAADVILKERRKLILVARETPLSLIHINNMKAITEAGGIICPATPSFYSKPKDFEALASTVIDRVLDLCGLDIKTYRWGEKTK